MNLWRYPKEGGLQRPFGEFPEIHPFWQQASLREGVQGKGDVKILEIGITIIINLVVINCVMICVSQKLLSSPPDATMTIFQNL